MTQSPRFPFQTIGDVKAANAEAGAMRNFRSRVESDLYGGRYFITSEQFVPFDGINPEPRKFTIREARPDATIRDVGGFQAWTSKRAAIHECRRLARETVYSRVPRKVAAHG